MYSIQEHTGTIWNIYFNNYQLISTSFDSQVLVFDFSGKLKSTSNGKRNRDVGRAEKDNTDMDVTLSI